MLSLSKSSGKPQSSLSATAVIGFMGRSLSVDGQCENSHRTGSDRPATIPQIEEA